MARAKSPLASVIIVALVLVLLYALNPTKEEFVAWRAAQAQSQAQGGAMTGLVGVMKKGAGAIAGAMTGGTASLFTPHNYLLFSTYSLGSNEYLGIARLFIKLK